MSAALSSVQKNKQILEEIDPVDAYVGSRLRLRRNLVGLSQDQLGRASGLTFQQIQKYERGTNRISASRLFDLARLLEVEVAWFFEGFSSAGAADRPQHGNHNRDQIQLAELPQKVDQLLYQRETMELIRGYYRIMSSRQRRKILELIKAMADSKE